MEKIFIPSSLIDKCIDNKIVFFVGAGFSKDFNYPDWKQLVNIMLRKIIKDKPKFSPFLEILENGSMGVLEILEVIKDEKQIIRDTIHDEFIYDNQKEYLLKKHRKLLDISSKIITTNYDKLLENASNHKIEPVLHTNNHMIGKLLNLNSYIYKLHGDHKEAGKCILLKEDYEKLYNNDNSALEQFKNIITNNTIIFIGFSLTDPYVSNMFQYINRIYEAFQPKNYIVSVNNEDFSNYNVENIKLETHEEVFPFLELLNQKIEEQKKDNKELSGEIVSEDVELNNRIIVRNSEIKIAQLDKENNFEKDESISNIYKNEYPSNFSLDTIQIKNNEVNYNFSKHIIIIKKYVTKIFYQKKSYTELVDKIGVILFFMDRIVYEVELIEGEKFSNIIQQFTRLIEEIESDHPDKFINLENLFNFSESWLLELYKRINSSNNSGNENRNEIEIKHIFGNLIEFVKDKEGEHFLEKMLISAEDTFKLIRDQNNEILLLKSDFSLISEIIISLILPIYINLQLIKKINVGTMIGQIDNEEIHILFNSIKSEYFSTTPLFSGRKKELHELIDSLTNNSVTIINGKKNTGKTTLISDFITQNDNKKNDLNKLLLLFTFKKSKSIVEMVRTIIEQSNINIINKIDTKELDILISQSLEESSRILNGNEILKLYFVEALKRVVQECGIVYLVIDSLELIEHQDEILMFLLKDVPEGCNLLLSTGENNESIMWVFENCVSHHSIKLERLTRDEISNITGMDDSNKDFATINDKVYELTNGQIPKIKKLYEFKKENNFNIKMLENIELDAMDDEDSLLMFEKYAEVSIDNDLLEETLLLVSLMEPIQPISLENIQLFLSHRNLNYKLPKIRSELKKISTQISEIRFNRIKLLNNEYATFLLTKYFSQKDREEFTHSVFIWLATDLKISLDFMSEFIKNMEENRLISNEKFNEYINEFIDISIKLGKIKRLFLLGITLYTGKKNEIDLALQFLNSASENGNSEALSFLGFIYSNGEKVEKDILKAEKMLRRASDLNNIKAKIILSTLLFEGTEISKNINEGKTLLEEAVLLGSEIAKLELAMRLLLAIDLEEDILKGNDLLENLVELENVEAMRIMGNRLLRGDGVKRDILAGTKLLGKSIEKGSKKAKLDLGKYFITSSETENNEGVKYLEELVNENYLDAKRYFSEVLIEGYMIQKDVPAGINLLMSLVSEGDEKSELVYSKLQIEGILIPQNIEKGKEILNNLIKKDNIDALCYLGDLLIEGKHVEKDIEYGINYLKKASSLGDSEATRNLALRFISGNGVTKDFVEGEKLFQIAINKGNLVAKYQYAKFLLEKKGSKQYQVEALSLLKSVASWGIPAAKIYLGNIYIDGDLVKRNIDKGLEYLNEAIELGNPMANRELGYRLIFGIILPKDITQGEALLRKAISMGDTLAKTILGHAIIIKETEKYDYIEGLQLLEKAAEVEPNAMRILGLILLKGIGGVKDNQKGEALLRRSHKEGDYHASLNLATMLLDGRFLSKDIKEGKQILLKLVNDNNDKAIIEYAKRLIAGNVIDKDISKGLELLEKLSDSNNLEASFEFATHLISGNFGVPKNILKGEQIIRDGEKRGHEESRRILARYLIDETLKENIENEGMKLLEKSVDMNDYQAMEDLGDLLIEGVKVEKDVNRAVLLFEKAIGNSDCKLNYALRLLEGDLIPKNKKRGIDLLIETLHEGDLYPRYKYAELLINGELIGKDIQKGYQMLDNLVVDGFTLAKKLLASNLVYGHGIERDINRGMKLFNELVDEKYASGIVMYAELLIDGKYIPKDVHKGEKLLRKISQKEKLDVDYLLARRYLEGDGLRKHISKGTNMLIKAVNGMSNDAMLEYGIRLKNGLKLTKNIAKGEELIEKATKKASPNELTHLGIIAYELKDFELATKLLFSAYEDGYTDGSGTSLAYMKRRNEINKDISLPSIFILLEQGLSNAKSTAILNLAISMVKDENMDDEWKKADSIINNLDISLKNIDWWREMADKDDDVEGHLVLGWLGKYRKIEDIDGITFKNRFIKVMDKGWFIPKWMLDDEVDQIVNISENLNQGFHKNETLVEL